MNSGLDVALATCLVLPERDPDEGCLAAALELSGIRGEALAWDDPEADFASARLTVLRSTWDYPARSREFRGWLERTAAVSELWNPLPVVQWNLHKRYLLDLEAAGIPVAPTALVQAGRPQTLKTLADERGWQTMVVKPAISANSMNTIRVDRADLRRGESHLRELLAAGDVLVQPYLSSVEEYGERALIWIDGELTHAVRKSPRFTGVDENVSKEPLPIRPDEARLAERAVDFVQKRLSERLLYARIDMAPLAPLAPPQAPKAPRAPRASDSASSPVVMELELIEPSLYFVQSARALELFVAAIQTRLDTYSS